jgi:hypothetical protein
MIIRPNLLKARAYLWDFRLLVYLPAAARYFFFSLGDVLRGAQNITKREEFA